MFCLNEVCVWMGCARKDGWCGEGLGGGGVVPLSVRRRFFIFFTFGLPLWFLR